jgi:hypothetical protein
LFAVREVGNALREEHTVGAPGDGAAAKRKILRARNKALWMTILIVSCQ